MNLENPFDFRKPGIYVILCLKTKFYFVGQSKKAQQKLNDHRRKLKTGVHENKKLQQDFECYGETNFIFKSLIFGIGANRGQRQKLKQLVLETIPFKQRYNKQKTLTERVELFNNIKKQNLKKALKKKKFIDLKQGLYVITCNINNKHYVGQSKNMSARLTAHKGLLRQNKHSIFFLQQDFNFYGEKNFNFKKLIFGVNKDLKSRLKFETLILNTLTLEQRYNTFVDHYNRKESVNPFSGKAHTLEAKQSQSLAKTKKILNLNEVSINVKEGFFLFTKSGLYVITCTINNRHYVGQSQNVKQRLNAHKSKLQRNIHENKRLQQDFNSYGLKNYNFKNLLFGTNVNLKKRLEFEVLILDTLSPEQRYNKYVNWNYRKTDVNQLDYSKLTKAKQIKHQFDFITKKSSYCKPVTIKNNYYESISQAHKKTGLTRKCIRKRCNDPAFKDFQWCLINE